MKTYLRKPIAFLTAIIFINSLILPGYVLAENGLNLPAPGAIVSLSEPFTPPILIGMKLDPADSMAFEFIVDHGDDDLGEGDFKAESQKLINYFMASLAIPEDQAWVNLSPYEKDRIMADGLSQTEMGRDMLAQDYLLKQLSSSMTHPENALGEEFWNAVYERAQAEYGTTDIPPTTFSKIWIVPEESLVYVKDNNVFIIKSKLDIKLEQDYLAMQKNMGNTNHGVGKVNEDEMNSINGITADVVRNVLLPAIKEEINHGKNFAPVRQIFHSVILASWYKKNLKESVLGKLYFDQSHVENIDLEDKHLKEKVYNQYVAAFKQGVYNMVKEEYDPNVQDVVPRKYFGGGIGDLAAKVNDQGTTAEDFGAFARWQAGRDQSSVQANVPVEDTETPDEDHALTVSRTDKLIEQAFVVISTVDAAWTIRQLVMGRPVKEIPSATQADLESVFNMSWEKIQEMIKENAKAKLFSGWRPDARKKALLQVINRDYFSKLSEDINSIGGLIDKINDPKIVQSLETVLRFDQESTVDAFFMTEDGIALIQELGRDLPEQDRELLVKNQLKRILQDTNRALDFLTRVVKTKNDIRLNRSAQTARQNIKQEAQTERQKAQQARQEAAKAEAKKKMIENTLEENAIRRQKAEDAQAVVNNAERANQEVEAKERELASIQKEARTQRLEVSDLREKAGDLSKEADGVAGKVLALQKEVRDLEGARTIAYSLTVNDIKDAAEKEAQKRSLESKTPQQILQLVRSTAIQNYEEARVQAESAEAIAKESGAQVQAATRRVKDISGSLQKKEQEARIDLDQSRQALTESEERLQQAENEAAAREKAFDAQMEVSEKIKEKNRQELAEVKKEEERLRQSVEKVIADREKRQEKIRIFSTLNEEAKNLSLEDKDQIEVLAKQIGVLASQTLEATLDRVRIVTQRNFNDEQKRLKSVGIAEKDAISRLKEVTTKLNAMSAEFSQREAAAEKEVEAVMGIAIDAQNRLQQAKEEVTQLQQVFDEKEFTLEELLEEGGQQLAEAQQSESRFKQNADDARKESFSAQKKADRLRKLKERVDSVSAENRNAVMQLARQAGFREEVAVMTEVEAQAVLTERRNRVLEAYEQVSQEVAGLKSVESEARASAAKLQQEADALESQILQNIKTAESLVTQAKQKALSLEANAQQAIADVDEVALATVALESAKREKEKLGQEKEKRLKELTKAEENLSEAGQRAQSSMEKIARIETVAREARRAAEQAELTQKGLQDALDELKTERDDLIDGMDQEDAEAQQRLTEVEESYLLTEKELKDATKIAELAMSKALQEAAKLEKVKPQEEQIVLTFEAADRERARIMETFRIVKDEDQRATTKGLQARTKMFSLDVKRRKEQALFDVAVREALTRDINEFAEIAEEEKAKARAAMQRAGQWDIEAKKIYLSPSQQLDAARKEKDWQQYAEVLTELISNQRIFITGAMVDYYLNTSGILSPDQESLYQSIVDVAGKNGITVTLVNREKIGGGEGGGQGAGEDFAVATQSDIANNRTGAMEKTGGIDFNPQMMSMKQAGEEFKYEVNINSLDDLNVENIQILSPIITGIAPITDFYLFVGISEKKDGTQKISRVSL